MITPNRYGLGQRLTYELHSRYKVLIFLFPRDVNCISCDANAVMDMDPGPNIPALKGLPPHHSMKPYLTYELGMFAATYSRFIQ